MKSLIKEILPSDPNWKMMQHLEAMQKLEDFEYWDEYEDFVKQQQEKDREEIVVEEIEVGEKLRNSWMTLWKFGKNIVSLLKKSDLELGFGKI